MRRLLIFLGRLWENVFSVIVRSFLLLIAVSCPRSKRKHIRRSFLDSALPWMHYPKKTPSQTRLVQKNSSNNKHDHIRGVKVFSSLQTLHYN